MNRDEYFLRIAYAVAARSSCVKRQCGALIVVDNHIVSTGYNGTPEGVLNCDDGGCARCQNRELRSGEKFDECICSHAERNAVYFAARHGVAVAGGRLYSTLRPCIWCLEACVQAGVRQVSYAEQWPDGYKKQPEHCRLELKVDVNWVRDITLRAP